MPRATRRARLWTLAAMLCAGTLCFVPRDAAAATVDPPATASGNTLERGQRIAVAVSTVTGAAVSPLFGVFVLGAYTYYKTPKTERALLPFYCAPGFWIPLALLLTMVLLKDTVGSVIPFLKKPLDAVEILVLNKAALLFTVLPVVWHEAAAITAAPHAVMYLPGIVSVAYAAGPATPAASGNFVPMALAVIMGSAAAIAVWLTGHALDVLALLSPIPWLDVLFKGARAAIFLTIGILTALNLKAALLVSLVIIGISLICFWWALRLAIFGAVFAWDMLRSGVFGQRRDPSLDGEVLGFTAYAMGGLRKRSFGSLRIAEGGELEFDRRPMGLGFRSAVRLQTPDRYEVGRGFFFPCLLSPGNGGKNYRFQFRLLPRYVGFEKEIRNVLHLAAVRDLRVPSELRGAWNWLHETIAGSKVS